MRTTLGANRMTRLRWRRLVIAATALLAACVAAFSWLEVRRAAVDRARLGSLPDGVRRSDLNVLVVTLDTTRADHLGTYGFQSISTPNIDWLAEDGVRFEQAVTVAPLTMPAHASLYTGRFPFRHGVRDNDAVLGNEETTLAERLKQRGYRTGAFVGAFVLAASRGLNQGFDVYRDDFGARQTSEASRELRRPANEVTDEALEWLDQQGGSRFFAWLHFYDAHAPYRPVEYDTTYGSRPYDAQIAFMDAQVGRLVGFLRRRELLKRTIVVVIGDHGEGLGDHRENGHGIFVYNSVVRVPFIIHAPFARLRGRIIDDVVRSVDLFPTVMDLIDASSTADDGTSLTPIMAGTVPTLGLEAYSESLYPLRFGWSDLRALRAGRFKVIAAPRPELYDVERDPFEDHDIYAAERSIGDQLIARLQKMEQSASSSALALEYPSVDADTAARLRSLGYVSRSAGAVAATDALPDPKDGIVELEERGRR